MNSDNNIQISRLSIQNFKNSPPKKPWLFDFSSGDAEEGSIDLFGGPNGYGKTTAFEAIKTCISGEMKSALDPQLNNKDSRKMPYVNDVDFDVLLKLELIEKTNEGNIHHIIGRRYPKDRDGKYGNERKNKAINFQHLLDAYYSNESSDFDKEGESGLFGRNKLKPAKELNEILKALLYKNRVEVEKGFDLLNYCSQATNLKFLAFDEREKRNRLSFLFNTETEESVVAFSKKTSQDLNKLRDTLITEIDKLKAINATPFQGGKVEFNSLIPSNSPDWDKENPFSDKAKKNQDQLSAWRKDVNEIREWIKRFDPRELAKQQKKNLLNTFFANSERAKSFLARELMQSPILDELDTTNERFSRLNDALKKIRNWKNEKSDQLTAALQAVGLTPGEIETLSASLTSLKAFEKLSSDASKAKSQVLNSRAELVKKFQELHAADPQDGHCPLCGHDHKTFDLLVQSISDHAAEISKTNSTLEKEIQEIQNQVLQVLNKAEILAAEGVSSPELKRKKELFMWVSNLKSKGYMAGFQEIIESATGLQIALDTYKLDANNSVEEFENTAQSFMANGLDTLRNYVVDAEKTSRPELFTRYFNSDAEALRQLKQEDFDEKLLYLESQFRSEISARLEIYEKRARHIEVVTSIIDKKAEAIDSKIKEYKSKTIRLLQIPMYVYSAKILQNCPQGEGIFITDNESNNALRFRIDNINEEKNRSDQDIAYHLSTGQLSVVAISFLLAINKLADSPLKFIGIDDPLQTLDDLNIHALVEVLRHDFRGMQFLFSTHEDDAAKYLFYRFKKAKFNTSYTDIRDKYFAGA